MKRQVVTLIVVTSCFLFCMVPSVEAHQIRGGENYGRKPVKIQTPGMGYCLIEEWRSPTANIYGKCEKIVYMIDIKDERHSLFRVGTSANIFLLRKDGLIRIKMATIKINSSGAGFTFNPKYYEDYVRFSNGQVRFLIELAPAGPIGGRVRIVNTQCRYVFKN